MIPGNLSMENAKKVTSCQMKTEFEKIQQW